MELWPLFKNKKKESQVCILEGPMPDQKSVTAMEFVELLLSVPYINQNHQEIMVIILTEGIIISIIGCAVTLCGWNNIITDLFYKNHNIRFLIMLLIFI